MRQFRRSFALWQLEAQLVQNRGTAAPRQPARELLPYKRLWLSVLAQVFYVRAQVTTWPAFIPYVRQYTRRSEREAGILLTVSLMALALGRILAVPLMRYVRPTRLIALYALINIAVLCVGALAPGAMGAFAILATSLFMSIIFPTIFAIGIKGLGPNTKLGGSVIVMSIIGGCGVSTAARRGRPLDRQSCAWVSCASGCVLRSRAVWLPGWSATHPQWWTSLFNTRER